MRRSVFSSPRAGPVNDQSFSDRRHSSLPHLTHLPQYILCYFLFSQAYVYALYSAWGFTQRQIGHIFVVGYASSATFGTLLASAGAERSARDVAGRA